MKLTFKLLQGLKLLSGVAATMLVTHAASAIQLTNEFWISTNTPTANLGTLADPIDGSTATKFDAAMSSMPAGAVIHILTGTYQTAGSAGWNAKPGQKISGSGIYNTRLILKSGSAQGTHGIESTSCSTNIVVSELTLDMNNNVNSHGVLLEGKAHSIRNVKVINASSSGATNEVIMLQINGCSGTDRNMIEGCEVSNFTPINGGACSAIWLGNTGGGSAAGIIQNNRVSLAPVSGQRAIAGAGQKNVLIQGNYVNGASAGIYAIGAGTNVTISHNIFKNCNYGFFTDNTRRQNNTIIFNNIQLAYSTTLARAGFYISPTGSGNYTNITIMGNTVQFDSQAGLLSYGVNAGNTTGLFMVNNLIDPVLTNYFGSSAPLKILNNTTLRGEYLTSINQHVMGNGTVRKIVNANYTAGYADNEICARTTGITVTLPSAVGRAGKKFLIADESGSGNITIAAASPDTINGGSSTTVTGAYTSKFVISDGANWFAH